MLQVGAIPARERAAVREQQESFGRVLATVLFTDIVDSTATAAVLGDAKWRRLIDEHDRLAKALPFTWAPGLVPRPRPGRSG